MITAFCIVEFYKLVINQNEEHVTVKIIESTENLDFDPANLKKEMKMLRHDNIIADFGQRTEGSIYYLFLEYACGFRELKQMKAWCQE